MEELKFNKIQVLIDGTDYTNHVPFSFKWSALLDEQLDEATLELIRVSIENFEPLVNVTVKIWNESDTTKVITHNFLIANDEAHELPVGSGKYNHTLYLIEETKYLEGFIVRSHGYVNALNNYYNTVLKTPSLYAYSGDTASGAASGSIRYYNIDDIGSPLSETTYNFPTCRSILTQKSDYEITLYDKSVAPVEDYQKNYILVEQGGERVFDSRTDTSVDMTASGTVTVNLSLGVVNVIYNLYGSVNNGSSSSTAKIISCAYTYALTVVDTAVLPKAWNARSAIERALIIAEPLREGDCPRFWLNPEQAAEFEKIEVPEFQFTQSNLREILQGIGQYIHGEPRLKGHEIYYDMYGSSEQTEPYSVYAAKEVSRTLDRYTTNIDSSVGNLVNSLGYAKGVFVEPFAGAAMSMRCETLYARVTESNMIFPTKFGINSVEKFEYYDDTNNKFYDITSYVFESADYNQMSSYEDSYPYAKAYALYYTRGSRGIKGFNFKEEAAITNVFKNYAIVNILTAVMGSNPNIGLYPKMQFRITYQAYMPARIQQNKSLIVAKKHFTTPYNQGQNVVESRYYGESLKGVVARLGNVDKVVTVVKQGLPTIPKVGTLYDDDYYISTVAVEVQPLTTKITLALSQDFNRYSAYVSLNRQKRQYEISEKAAYESMLSYRDYCIIGDSVTSYGAALVSVGNVIKFINNPEETDKPLTLAVCEGLNENDKTCGKRALAVQAVASGNAAVFLTKYADNYSAGDSAQALSEVVNKIQGYFQQGVQYTDAFGNAEKLRFDYYTGGSPLADHEFDLASSLPSAKYLQPDGSALITTGDNPLWVKKGSTEILGINYQIDFVSNCRSIVIGSGFAKYCSLVNGYDNTAVWLWLSKKRLNKFERTYDISQSFRVSFPGFELSADGRKAFFKPFIITDNYSNIKSWALVKNGEVIFGENKDFAVGDDIFSDGTNPLQITMAHDYLPFAYSQKTTDTVTVTPISSGKMYTVDYTTAYDNSVWISTNKFSAKQDKDGIWHIVGKTYSSNAVNVELSIFTWR
jgi:hypothetical protein